MVEVERWREVDLEETEEEEEGILSGGWDSNGEEEEIDFEGWVRLES